MSRFFYILFGISYTLMIIYPICDESQDSKDSISNIVYEILKSKNEIFNAFNAITTKLMDASFGNKVDSIIDGKFVLHIYVSTNLVQRIFNKNNLYQKYTGDGKLKKEK